MLQPCNLVINKNSGSLKGIDEVTLREILEQSDLPLKVINIVSGSEIEGSIKSLAEDDTPLIIGGGDGTIKSAAEILMAKNKAFGILPLGTMNLLGNDLKIPAGLSESLKAYERGIKETSIDVASVNDNFFLCSAAVGIIPESSEFREKNRDQSNILLVPRLTKFIFDNIDRHEKRKLKLTVGSKKYSLKTPCVVVSNNRYGWRSEGIGPNFKRESVRNGILGVYSVAPKTIWQKLRLLFRINLGTWQRDPVINEKTGTRVIIDTKSHKELISLDGEVCHFETPLVFAVHPLALKLLLPPGQ